jgi:hypothetical protein
MSNVYYNPEDFGLEVVGSVDVGEMYEFDMFVVFRETATGRIGYATDSGCSCPSPFEDTEIDDIEWAPSWVVARELQEYAAGKEADDVANLISNMVM